MTQAEHTRQSDDLALSDFVEQGLTSESLAYWCRDYKLEGSGICVYVLQYVYGRVVVCWGQLSASATFFPGPIESEAGCRHRTPQPTRQPAVLRAI